MGNFKLLNFLSLLENNYDLELATINTYSKYFPELALLKILNLLDFYPYKKELLEQLIEIINTINDFDTLIQIILNLDDFQTHIIESFLIKHKIFNQNLFEFFPKLRNYYLMLKNDTEKIEIESLKTALLLKNQEISFKELDKFNIDPIFKENIRKILNFEPLENFNPKHKEIFKNFAKKVNNYTVLFQFESTEENALRSLNLDFNFKSKKSLAIKHILENNLQKAIEIYPIIKKFLNNYSPLVVFKNTHWALIIGQYKIITGSNFSPEKIKITTINLDNLDFIKAESFEETLVKFEKLIKYLINHPFLSLYKKFKLSKDLKNIIETLNPIIIEDEEKVLKNLKPPSIGFSKLLKKTIDENALLVIDSLNKELLAELSYTDTKFYPEIKNFEFEEKRLCPLALIADGSQDAFLEAMKLLTRKWLTKNKEFFPIKNCQDCQLKNNCIVYPNKGLKVIFATNYENLFELNQTVKIDNEKYFYYWGTLFSVLPKSIKELYMPFVRKFKEFGNIYFEPNILRQKKSTNPAIVIIENFPKNISYVLGEIFNYKITYEYRTNPYKPIQIQSEKILPFESEVSKSFEEEFKKLLSIVPIKSKFKLTSRFFKTTFDLTTATTQINRIDDSFNVIPLTEDIDPSSENFNYIKWKELLLDDKTIINAPFPDKEPVIIKTTLKLLPNPKLPMPKNFATTFKNLSLKQSRMLFFNSKVKRLLQSWPFYQFLLNLKFLLKNNKNYFIADFDDLFYPYENLKDTILSNLEEISFIQILNRKKVQEHAFFISNKDILLKKLSKTISKTLEIIKQYEYFLMGNFTFINDFEVVKFLKLLNIVEENKLGEIKLTTKPTEFPTIIENLQDDLKQIIFNLNENSLILEEELINLIKNFNLRTSSDLLIKILKKHIHIGLSPSVPVKYSHYFNEIKILDISNMDEYLKFILSFRISFIKILEHFEKNKTDYD